ncbi:MAG: hypothetical protein DRP01_06135 [Archaeoglobales archaeon]|nr:MAG: hypothetical protein DRP01_06135 [Archaeoglobales archaeon]
MLLGITKGVTSWDSQSHTVERHMDNAAYTSAHPDDTLVLAGPPRFDDVRQEDVSGWASLLAIGMLQTFQVTSQKPTQPMAAIGSGRAFFVSGKSQTTWRIGRLFTNGRNLLRVLSHNCVAGDVQVQNFDDPPVPVPEGRNLTNFYINLDSELYYVPFGLGIMFKDKMHDVLGAFYAELCMINTYTLGFTAGQNMIMEDVGGMCDRLYPFVPSMVMGEHVDRKTVDAVIGFAGGDPSVSENFESGVTDEL